MDDLFGLCGATEPFEARFTRFKVAAVRLMGAPAAGFSGVAHAQQRMGIGLVQPGIDIPPAFLRCSHVLGGVHHLDALRVLRQQLQADDVVR